MPVQGVPGSNYIGPVESLLMVSYLTSFESSIVSIFIFEIFDEKVLWPRFRTVRGQSRSKTMVPIDSPWVISYSTSIDPIIVSVISFEIFDCNFDEFESAQFKAIQGQTSCAHWWFFIWPRLCAHCISHGIRYNTIWCEIYV